MKPKPNIAFILTDDQGWKDLSCTGSLYYPTPHIDRLAETDAEMPLSNDSFDRAAPAIEDKRFTWELALKERAEHQRKLRASELGRQ
jgi:hypothetical protein